MFPSRVLVAGAGAIGFVFGGFLRKAGCDVTLLGREEHLKAIEAGGLEIDGIWGCHGTDGFRLARRVAELSEPYDLILFAVKAYDTRSMVESVAPYLDPGGIVLSLQNGLGNVEVLGEKFGSSRSLGASVLVGARIPQPGSVTVTVYASPVVMGPLEPEAGEAAERVSLLASLFSQAGIPCEPRAEILPHLWAKVFYNAALNPLGALLRVHYGVLGEDPSTRDVMDRVIDEAFKVAQKRRVRLPWKSVAEYRELFYGKLLPATIDHRSSMLQDLERGRRTEIDALNGKICRYGEELEVATPFNAVLTRLIRAKERMAPERRSA